MSAGVVVRPAVPADARALAGLVDALADYERLARPDAAARDRLRGDLFGPAPRLRALLALVDGQPVGYALFFPTYSSFLARPTLYLEDIFVIPEARGQRVGLALMRTLARLAVEEGCGRMEWTVLNWNQLAIDFYDRLGARPMEEWTTYRLDAGALAAVAGAA